MDIANKNITKLLILILSLLFISNCARQEQNKMNLAGEWSFSIDTADIGLSQNWHTKSLSGTIKLPGAMRDYGKGMEPDLQTNWTGSIYDSSFYYSPNYKKYRQNNDIKFPFWLTPKKHYVGPAWYQKEVIIPQEWSKKIILNLERPHWETMVWVDSSKVGMRNSLSTPHKYDLTTYLSSGKNRITIRVDNRIKEINVGPDSHSLTDHTQGNWNGITGDIKLLTKPLVNIGNIKVAPQIENKSINISVEIKNSNKDMINGSLNLSARSINTKNTHRVEPKKINFQSKSKDTTIDIRYNLGENVKLWSAVDPSLYKLKIELRDNNGNTDIEKVQFGMRNFATEGTNFTINGKKTFLRGMVECCVFPKTGYPPTEVSKWTEIFKKLKEYGLNHMRFHSWCPPEAAFIAADKQGVYLQPEAPTWANHGTSLGEGLPIDKYLYKETKNIINEYGNHPSFVMMAVGGNEPAGSHQVEYLNKLVNYWKKRDARRLFTGASIGGSWPIAPESEFIVRADARGVPWNKRPQTMFDHANKIDSIDKPYVAHESGQFNVFPNFDEMKKYTGVYEPKNFEYFKNELKEHHMIDKAEDFLMASGNLQALGYKHEIEAALRTKELAGFQLLNLTDFPGQGTALIGVLDAFWDEKGYIDSKEFTRFSDSTVPLARFPKFVYTSAETLKVDLEVTHYGSKPIKNATPVVSITGAQGKVFDKKQLNTTDIPLGSSIPLGLYNLPLSSISQPRKLKLELKVNAHKNNWEFWVYPEKLPPVDTSEIFITNSFNNKTKNILKKGGNVFLDASGKVENGKNVKQYFRPVFWNTSWFQMRPPHTLGILCKDEHPAFEYFPTEYYSDMKWWSILNRQQVMRLNNFPKDFEPLVQPIDTYHLNRRLGAIFEAKVRNGKILVSSSNLTDNLRNRPAARQLFYSLKKYMASSKFKPKNSVKVSTIKELFVEKDRDYLNFYTEESTEDLKPEED